MGHSPEVVEARRKLLSPSSDSSLPPVTCAHLGESGPGSPPRGSSEMWGEPGQMAGWHNGAAASCVPSGMFGRGCCCIHWATKGLCKATKILQWSRHGPSLTRLGDHHANNPNITQGRVYWGLFQRFRRGPEWGGNRKFWCRKGDAFPRGLPSLSLGGWEESCRGMKQRWSDTFTKALLTNRAKAFQPSPWCTRKTEPSPSCSRPTVSSPLPPAQCGAWGGHLRILADPDCD